MPKVSQLDAVTTVTAADNFLIDDDGVSKRITGANLLSHTGDVTGDETGVLTIPNNTVTNLKAAQIAEQSFKGRITSGTGVVEDLKVSDLPDDASPSVTVKLFAEDDSGNMVSVEVGNLPTAAGSGEINTASSVGTGASLVKAKSTYDLPFRSILCSTGHITVTESTNTVDLSIPAGGVPLSRLANTANQTMLGNVSGGGAAPIALSKTQILTLLNVADGSTANDTNANLLNRANHTGSQTMSTISDAGALATLDNVEEPAIISAVEFNTDLVAASTTPVIAFPLPYACTFSTRPEAYIHTAPTGSAATIDIHLAGTTIFSTKLTVDATETSSTTAATPAELSTTTGTKGQLVEILVDGVGSTTAGTGLTVTMFLTKT